VIEAYESALKVEKTSEPTMDSVLLEVDAVLNKLPLNVKEAIEKDQSKRFLPQYLNKDHVAHEMLWGDLATDFPLIFPEFAEEVIKDGDNQGSSAVDPDYKYMMDFFSGSENDVKEDEMRDLLPDVKRDLLQERKFEMQDSIFTTFSEQMDNKMNAHTYGLNTQMQKTDKHSRDDPPNTIGLD
jgi:hypothetical protein